jgi:hypothetical protein
MTEVIFWSVCSIECLWVSGAAAQGAILVKEMTANNTSTATIMTFLYFKI